MDYKIKQELQSVFVIMKGKVNWPAVEDERTCQLVRRSPGKKGCEKFRSKETRFHSKLVEFDLFRE